MKNVTDKRSALLQAALELFAQNGFDGSPTAQIAKRAGVASGTLFLYFKNKEELIHELFREVNQQLDNIMVPCLAKDIPIQEKLINTLSFALRYLLDNPKEFKFVEQYHFSPLKERANLPDGSKEHFMELLQEAQEQKIVKDAPLVILEAIAFGPISHLVKEHSSRGTPVDEEMIQLVVRACWDGLKR